MDDAHPTDLRKSDWQWDLIRWKSGRSGDHCLEIAEFDILPQHNPVIKAFYSLRKALGIHANNLHSIDIDGNSYRNNKFIVGFDTEKLLGLSFTGMNTRNSLMTAHLKTGTGDYQADRMHIVLLSEQILEIGNYGVIVFD